MHYTGYLYYVMHCYNTHVVKSQTIICFFDLLYLILIHAQHKALNIVTESEKKIIFLVQTRYLNGYKFK